MTSNNENGRAHLGAIPGFANYNEQEHYVFANWLSEVAEVFKIHGFTPFISRPFEFSKHLLQKGGDDKQIYGVSRLQDQTLTDMGIPFDHTVPLAIFVAQRMQSLIFPYKRYDMSHSFRGESPQAGRFRGFIQADVDIIDRNLNVLSDFQCISAVIDALKILKIGDIKVFLNHIAIAKGMIESAGIPKNCESDVLRWIDKMDKLPHEEIIQGVHKIVPQIEFSQIEALIHRFDFSSSPEKFDLDFIHDSKVDLAFSELKTLHQLLIASGINPDYLLFSPGKVRGLNYYTGIVFETLLVGKEKYGSIASGGRYSNLIEGFAENKMTIEGVGGSIGLTRLFDILTRTGNIECKRKTTANFLILCRTDDLQTIAIDLATQLRDEGQYVDIYSKPGTKIAKQLEYADKKGIPAVIMIMDRNVFVVKNLDSGEQTEHSSITDILARIKK